MEFFKEIEELKKIILPSLAVFILLFLFFFAFGLETVDFRGVEIFIPSPSLHSFSVLFFEKMQRDLVPSDVKLIATNPLSAFSAQMIIALFLALFISLPFFLYKSVKYLSPAFRPAEKKKIAKAWLPSFLLFLAGSFFSYFFIIPATLKILYTYPAVMGVTPFFNVNEFVILVFGLIVATGVMFLLPIFMALLSRLGIVGRVFWKKNWRYAISAFLIFSAIITPDGTGVTMLILTLPLSGLYFLGYLLSGPAKKVEV